MRRKVRVKRCRSPGPGERPRFRGRPEAQLSSSLTHLHGGSRTPRTRTGGLGGCLLRGRCDRVEFSPRLRRASFFDAGCVFRRGGTGAWPFEDRGLEAYRRLIDNMEPIVVFVGLWSAPQFVNQEGDRGGGQSEQSQDDKHLFFLARFVPIAVQKPDCAFVLEAISFPPDGKAVSVVVRCFANPVSFRYTFVCHMYTSLTRRTVTAPSLSCLTMTENCHGRVARFFFKCGPDEKSP